MARVFGREYSRRELERRVGDIRQIAGIDGMELSAGRERGSRVYEMRTGGGLRIPILADRGMGIGALSLDGLPLAFATPAGAADPAHASPSGKGWLDVFPGGFLATCGLTQVGPPCVDTDQGAEEACGQHGRLSLLPAGPVSCETAWQDDERMLLRVSGAVRESSFFGHDLELERTVTSWLGSSAFTICDRVRNCGFKRSPFMLLQHFNLGFPLLSPGGGLRCDVLSTAPRDAAAARGLERCFSFEEPQPDFPEQVFYHDCRPDADGKVSVGFVNPSVDGRSLSVLWRYRKADYPHLVQWKCMLDGAYACGVEPSNCLPEGRAGARKAGRLLFLEPGESVEKTIEVSLAVGPGA